ncbi:McbB family protein [Mixta tenebrionis]|uniref:McbB family protein n=1 Tax=Mixta tenebrionis TaxID=2562439 RepID=A0A506VBC2_9GAMM|nr:MULTISPECIES: McbB family protein [Mixta]QHM74898.1 hypothetical protein C7M52_00842 [Mixta theicola]TPW42796.1 McbB family protein [Mixta tenebrionis]
MLIVMPYELAKQDEKTLVISYLSSVDIEHEGMKQLLEKLSLKPGWFQEEELNDLFEKYHIRADTGLSFLLDNGLIKKKPSSQQELWTQVQIISDNLSLFSEEADSWRCEGIDICGVSPVSDIPPALPDNTLVWIHLENYRRPLINNVYAALKQQRNIAFIQSYYQKEIFRIDGVYSPELGTPCHNCHLERWLNREIKSFGQNEQSWGKLLNLLDERKIALPAVAVRKTEREFSRHLIKRRLQELAGNSLVNLHVDTFMSSVSADLVTCRLNREPVIHWYACDCIGG